MGRQDKERQDRLEPQRIQMAITNIDSLGLEIIQIDDKFIKFKFEYEVITYWPYSGWHSGKSIKDGRGWNKLFKQLKS